MVERKIDNHFLFNNQSGFTLMEVMIAIAIFAVFASVFVTGQGYNLLDSSKLREEILLKDIGENKINDIVTNPPELRDSLTMSKETKADEKNPDYIVTVEYKKFFVPEMSKIVGNEGDDKKQEESNQSQLEKRIFKIFKDNMEKMLWQVEVTVKNKNTDSQLKFSSWLYNNNAEVQIGQF